MAQLALFQNHVDDIPTDSDSQYTPVSLIEVVKAFYGGRIDTDPCCENVRNPRTGARWCYDLEINGLAMNWKGKVFANIPYSQPEPWAEKAVREYRSGNASEVLFLCKFDPSTGWWGALSDYPVLTFSRLTFFKPSEPDRKGGANFPSAMIYLGWKSPGVVDRHFRQYRKYKKMYLPL